MPSFKMKKEFVCVKPRTKVATDRVVNRMDRLHSCKVADRSDGQLFLESISGRYKFTMFEGSDDNWEILR